MYTQTNSVLHCYVNRGKHMTDGVILLLSLFPFEERYNVPCIVGKWVKYTINQLKEKTIITNSVHCFSHNKSIELHAN